MVFLANSLDDVGLQFPAVRTAKEKFIAFESNWDAISRFPFTRDVTVGGSEVIFPGVDHAFQINHNRGARQVRSGFTQNFGFSLLPVFDVLTFPGAGLPVQLLGAVSDCVLQLKRRILGFLRHRNCFTLIVLAGLIILAIDTGTHEAGAQKGAVVVTLGNKSSGGSVREFHSVASNCGERLQLTRVTGEA